MFILHDMHFNANHAYSADSHFENQHFSGTSSGHADLGDLSDQHFSGTSAGHSDLGDLSD